MTKRCLYCGKVIKRNYGEAMKRYLKKKFCSNKCSVRFRSTDWAPEIERVVEYRYYCELCGEDRQHMFVNTKHGIRCGVCGYPAGKDEIVQLRVIKGEEVIDVGGEEDEW